jgi:hypothetical protein
VSIRRVASIRRLREARRETGRLLSLREADLCRAVLPETRRRSSRFLPETRPRGREEGRKSFWKGRRRTKICDRKGCTRGPGGDATSIRRASFSRSPVEAVGASKPYTPKLDTEGGRTSFAEEHHDEQSAKEKVLCEAQKLFPSLPPFLCVEFLETEVLRQSATRRQQRPHIVDLIAAYRESMARSGNNDLTSST